VTGVRPESVAGLIGIRAIVRLRAYSGIRGRRMVGGEIGDGREGRTSLRDYLLPNHARLESALKNSIVIGAVSWQVDTEDQDLRIAVSTAH
jgi:hypothetical protein